MPPTPSNSISLKTAALISGFCLLVMVIAAPIAEMYAYPKLVVSGNLSDTVQNLSTQKGLFLICIMGYLLTFVLDIVVAWSLHLFLKPVNAEGSLLTAWFRVVYTVVAFVALLNLVSVYRMLHAPTGFLLDNESNNLQIAHYLNAFKSQWQFGFVFFSLHLILLGYLAVKSSYIPKLFGILLIVNGLGYLVNTLKPFLFPTVNISFVSFTFLGEIVFMFWLLIKGWRVK